MYSARDQDTILSELQDASTIDASKIEGSFENDVLASNSIEFAKIEVELEQAYKASFATTSWADYLTMRCAEARIIRKEATKAIGTVTVTGNGNVPLGSTFATEDGISFVTTEAMTIKQSGDIAVQAVTAGVSGNVVSDTVIDILMSIPGITGVTNQNAMSEGYDEESDEDLLNRYLIHVRTPGTSGNTSHYLEWTTSVAGVGAVKVVSTWNGPTTVKVIIVNNDFQEASAELIKKVADYIESVRPVGAVVTVISATPKIINISAEITGTVDKEAFSEAVISYFTTLERSDITGSDLVQVSYAKIGALLLSCGAEDYTNLQLNSGTTNITLSSEEFAAVGEVVLS